MARRKATAAIAMLIIGIAAVAYASASPRVGGAGDRAAPAAKGHPTPVVSKYLPPAARPRILVRPEAITTATSAVIRFSAADVRRPRFQCRLDGGGWAVCRSPVTYQGLAPGSHVFRVKVHSARRPLSRSGKAIWLVVEPREFSITPLFSGLDRLYPGAPAVQLPVRLDNPNPLPIVVTEVRVSVTRDPGGCDPATNLELLPAGLSPASPLTLPAGGSASIPSPGVDAPAIRMLDLPFSQDACQGAGFAIDFQGSAHG